MYVYSPSLCRGARFSLERPLDYEKGFASKIIEPSHELTFGLNYGTRDVWLVSGTTVKLHSRAIKLVDVQHSVKRHAPFHIVGLAKQLFFAS